MIWNADMLEMSERERGLLSHMVAISVSKEILKKDKIKDYTKMIDV